MPFVETGEIRTHYEVFGTGPPIVFAHGLGGRCEREIDWARRAASLGCTVIVYSVRGHGKTTPCDDPSAYTFPSLASDLEKFLDALDISRCVLGGGSMGAAITLSFSLRNPERVLGLMQVMPAFGSSPNQLISNGFRALASVIRNRGAEEAVRMLFNNLEALAAHERANPGMMSDLIEQWSAHEQESFATAMETLPSQSPFGSIDDLRQLKAPVLVVAVHDDPIHPLEVALAYCRRFPDRRLVCLKPLLRSEQAAAAIATLAASFAKMCYRRNRQGSPN